MVSDTFSMIFNFLHGAGNRKNRELSLYGKGGSLFLAHVLFFVRRVLVQLLKHHFVIGGCSIGGIVFGREVDIPGRTLEGLQGPYRGTPGGVEGLNTYFAGSIHSASISSAPSNCTAERIGACRVFDREDGADRGCGTTGWRIAIAAGEYKVIIRTIALLFDSP